MLHQSFKKTLGKWDFNLIQLRDMEMYAEYIRVCEYPATLWSSNFAYLWAASQSSLRDVLWKIVDGMLVSFGHSYKNTLYLFCLPFGKGDSAQLMQVVHECLKYCYEWNNRESHRTMVRMVNQQQMDFLRNGKNETDPFKFVTLQGIERHLDVKKMVTLTGKDFSTIRTKVNKFHRENPEATIRRYCKTDFDELIGLEKTWSTIAGKKYPNIIDNVYYKELVDHCEELQQLILVIEQGKRIVGMVAGGALPTGQAWGSLLKYQAGIAGLSETLSVEFVRELYKTNPLIELLNIGSDLGPGGLREYKLKFRPVVNLKRYQVYLG